MRAKSCFVILAAAVFSISIAGGSAVAQAVNVRMNGVVDTAEVGLPNTGSSVKGDLSIARLATLSEEYSESSTQLVDNHGIDYAIARGTHLLVELENRCAELQHTTKEDDIRVENSCRDARNSVENTLNELRKEAE